MLKKLLVTSLLVCVSGVVSASAQDVSKISPEELIKLSKEELLAQLEREQLIGEGLKRIGEGLKRIEGSKGLKVGGIGTGDDVINVVDIDNGFYEVTVKMKEGNSEKEVTFGVVKEPEMTTRAGWEALNYDEEYEGIYRYDVSTGTQIDVCMGWQKMNERITTCSTVPLEVGSHYVQGFEDIVVTAQVDYNTFR